MKAAKLHISVRQCLPDLPAVLQTLISPPTPEKCIDPHILNTISLLEKNKRNTHCHRRPPVHPRSQSIHFKASKLPSLAVQFSANTSPVLDKKRQIEWKLANRNGSKRLFEDISLPALTKRCSYNDFSALSEKNRRRGWQ